MIHRGRLEVKCEDEVFSIDYDNLDDMLCKAAEYIAYGDCTDETVERIMWDNREIRYCGWMPAMEYQFAYVDSGEICFHAFFPEWEH